MANEYRFYQINLDAAHSGDPVAPGRVYAVSAEVAHTGVVDSPVRFFQLKLEVIRDIRDRFTLLVAESTSEVPDGFSFKLAYGWDTVGDGAEGLPPSFVINPTPKVEWNPYRPDVPHEVADTDSALYDYLREQAEIIREQHDQQQAGDSTFPWELMVQTSAERLFTLGSLSRFYHADYGMLYARYVRFSPRWINALHTPVGRDLKYDDWVVTHQIAHSHWTQLVGISLTYDREVAGRYGWVLVQGRGIVPLHVYGVSPVQWSRLTWVSDGYVGFGAGKVIALILEDEHVASQGGDTWSVPRAEWACDLDGVTDEYLRQALAPALEIIDMRLDAIELALSGGVVNYQPQIDAINASLVSLANALESEAQQRLQVDSGLHQRIQALESATTSGVSHEEFNLLVDRVTSIEDVLAPQVAALADAVGTISATVGGHETRITILESQTSSLASSVGGIPPPLTVTPGSFTNTDLTIDEYGRVTAAANGTSGGGSDGFQPPESYSVYGQIGTSTVQSLGAAAVISGTTSGSYASTNFVTKMNRTILAPSTGANQFAQCRTSTGLAYMPRGWDLEAMVGIEVGLSTGRIIAGGQAGWSGTADPSTSPDIVALAADSGDSNMQIMHNDASGTATKIDLGSNFPKTTGAAYKVEFDCAVGGASIDYTVTRLDAAFTASGTLTTDLPVSPPYPGFWVATGGPGGTIQGALARITFALKAQ